ncbi:dTDP-4-dehydrorhamnose reductase [Leifsonia xyli subsp. xyli str. CTCB07]|uniref:dTDP-4-dehydrorhamnose reductase n=2 Tax=Leifsonia xyli subsp. xyli TaxID=59736 RepID=Q6AGK6_LEIXX|nr:SDR family oxidoreductase [Leifsonia xyli]AAT88489.1 dTDP-4-dehydrorhamnose reductase [Leifsonia xyli subsp. xyli str. CTCB07]
MSARVLVLGATGMLGSTVASILRRSGHDVTGTVRDLALVPAGRRDRHRLFDAFADDPSGLLEGLSSGDYVINCIGLIKHHLRDDDAGDRYNAIKINAELPYALARAAGERNVRVIQIATDCVYSGQTGRYDETTAHDATDVYGQSKSLGEVPGDHFLNLRCSIIGPEQKNRDSLLEWVLAHEPGSTFNGYLDHRWNGVTTDVFAAIAAGIVQTGSTLSGTHHLVPADSVDKDALSRLILSAYGREDVSVVPVETGTPVDRTLTTIHPDVNAALWRDAGYDEIPTIETMVRTLASESIERDS